MHFVYILYSKGFDKYYIGETEDVERRIYYHNHGEKATYTKRYRPWELIRCWHLQRITITDGAEIIS